MGFVAFVVGGLWCYGRRFDLRRGHTEVDSESALVKESCSDFVITCARKKPVSNMREGSYDIRQIPDKNGP